MGINLQAFLDLSRGYKYAVVYFVYIFAILMLDHEGMLSKYAKAIPDVTF